MQYFINTWLRLQNTSTDSGKARILNQFFRSATKQEQILGLYLFPSSRLARLITSSKLKALYLEAYPMPDWLYSECQKLTGDNVETISLLLNGSLRISSADKEGILLSALSDLLSDMPINPLSTFILASWQQLSSEELLLFNKLITGTFRPYVEPHLLFQTFAEQYNLDWQKVASYVAKLKFPTATDFDVLLNAAEATTGVMPIEKPHKTILAVLLYSEQQNLTFGLWDEERDTLINIGKAELNQNNISRRDLAAFNNWLRENTVEKFGPVRVVTQQLVFKLEYETLEKSPRRKSGVKLVGLKVISWEKTATVAAADKFSLLSQSLSGSNN